MTVEDMRSSIAARYPNSDNWQKRCKGMKTRQVVAIYFSFLARDQVDKGIQKTSEGSLPCDKGNYKQMTMWDYFWR